MGEQNENPGAMAAEPLAGKTMVLFEDDELVQRATLRMLQRLGATVFVSASSGEALERLRQADTVPDWVVADYWFTRQEDGLAAATAVRAALGPKVRGLIVTGDGSPAIAASVEAAGFHLLRKPVNIDLFISILAEDN